MQGKREMMRVRSRSLILVIILGFMLIPHVYADGPADVNLLDLPQNLANALGIPLYAGKLLACACFVFLLLFPTVIFVRRSLEYVLILEGFLLLGFFVAVQWLEFWYILVFVLIVAGLWASKMKGVFY